MCWRLRKGSIKLVGDFSPFFRVVLFASVFEKIFPSSFSLISTGVLSSSSYLKKVICSKFVCTCEKKREVSSSSWKSPQLTFLQFVSSFFIHPFTWPSSSRKIFASFGDLKLSLAFFFLLSSDDGLSLRELSLQNPCCVC